MSLHVSPDLEHSMAISGVHLLVVRVINNEDLVASDVAVYILTFPMAFLNFLYFYGLTLALKPREVINPFPCLSYFIFDSEDVIFILSRLSNFDDMSKVTYSSLPLISLCFLSLQRPQFFMFTAKNNFSSPLKFSS